MFALRVLLLAPLLIVCGCAAAPAPRVVVLDSPVSVQTPVAMPCVDASVVPARPETASDDALESLGDGDLLLTIARDRAALLADEAKLRALLAGCTRRAIPPGAAQ